MNRRQAGASPGTLVHRGHRFVDEPRLQAHRYSETQAQPIPASSNSLPPADGRMWLELTGIHDAQLMGRLKEAYGIPELVLEDAMATDQRPKFETTDRGAFLVMRMFQWVEGALDEEQVGVWWHEGTLVSFQEKPGDCLDPVRDRLHKKGGRIRRLGTSYLAYAIADAIVDHFFVVLEGVGEEIATMEEMILEDWQGASLSRVQALRASLLRLRRAIAPLRDVAASMLHAEGTFPATMRPYLRDLHDHTVQALDQVEQQRELVASLRDLWMNAQSAHMNRVMQTLTVVATIFIPLTFLAGVYGMNFEYMPELQYRWAYPAFVVTMAVLAVGLLAWFRYRGWLGRN